MYLCLWGISDDALILIGISKLQETMRGVIVRGGTAVISTGGGGEGCQTRQ